MYRDSLIEDNLLNINYIQRFCDHRIDLTSHSMLMGHLCFEHPFVGHAIVENEILSEHDKWEIVMDKLANKSVLGMILGKRRHGKTALMYELFRKIHERYPKKPIAIAGVLPNIKNFPSWIKPIVETSEAEEGSIIGFDEAAIRFQARRAMSTENVQEIIEMVVSGHKNFSVLYLVQNSSLVDISIIRMSEIFFFKRLTMSDLGIDDTTRRRALAPIQRYLNILQPRGQESDMRETLYIDDDMKAFIFENDLPPFWSDEFSKPYAKFRGDIEIVDFIVSCWSKGVSRKVIRKELLARDANWTNKEIDNAINAPAKVKANIRELVKGR